MELTKVWEQEIIRLILQFLSDHGYGSTLKCLENESGLCYETENVKTFQTAVLSGDWQIAESCFALMKLRDESKRDEALFLLQKQKCLELAEKGSLCEAIFVLQTTNNTYFNQSKEELISQIMFSRKKFTESAHGVKDNRPALLNELSLYISADIMMPKNRLLELLEQAKNHQISSQCYHNVLKNFTFLSDYQAEPSEIPTKEIHCFDDHTSEVWQISYSNNGKYLASASQDKSTIIFDLANMKMLHRLIGHSKEVAYVKWSPDDRYLLTCSNDYSVILWDAFTGEKIRHLKEHTYFVSCCCWLPDGLSFITGSPDMTIIHWSLTGEIMHKWKDVNIYDMAINNDGTKLYAVGYQKQMESEDKHIAVYSIPTRECLKKIHLESKVTSISLSKDSRYALTNIEPHTILLWDIQEYRIIRQYMGHKLGNWLIGSCFGGQDDTFVLSGSQDEFIRIWHRDSGKLLSTLPGHSKCVNYIAYNPLDPYQFASASDDNTIRIWSNKGRQ
ncbi:WD repeat protein [Schizosaccharomyces octosporus yFS286]|uniref:WD repeat protein n=1 Tax=Schizosaccharomyces octosporus (strain yFS286) TaxID=483514 RepID=S9RLS4_SCHOY|nr:WD repeat protein [Schizosaccharomyces octosporus yFS286]EPX74929.1 WD repeat protein [Schizosaccharomyces octosporus yFS286]